MLGHKADIGFMALGPDLWRLRAFQAAIQGAGLELVASYVSLTEVSEYAKGMPEEMLASAAVPAAPARGEAGVLLLPDVEATRRAVNWFALPFDDRKELMTGHGATGRTFAGRVVQVDHRLGRHRRLRVGRVVLRRQPR